MRSLAGKVYDSAGVSSSDLLPLLFAFSILTPRLFPLQTCAYTAVPAFRRSNGRSSIGSTLLASG